MPIIYNSSDDDDIVAARAELDDDYDRDSQHQPIRYTHAIIGALITAATILILIYLANA